MFFKKPKQISINDAEKQFETKGILSNPVDLRKKVKILAIDDQNFTPEKNLKNSGFDIDVISDIQRIKETELFQIILCDVNGIGSNLSQDTQGAYVIDEIKKIYPEKIVIANTAGSDASAIVKAAKNNADHYIKKDANIEEWRDLLDESIRNASNPIFLWKQERMRLLTAGIELQDLLAIENSVLSNLGKGAIAVKNAIESTSDTSQTSWGKEITKFMASKSFDIAFDYIFQ